MPPVLVILGPTATGKSRLALAVARRLGGEIVNADALQVYRGLDIGTAKPTPSERARVPHHLIDILEPGERFSAGRFARLARAAIEEIHRRSRPALVVGGSGLYLRALIEGLSPLPPADPHLRRSLEERLRAEGLPALRAELSELDPATAERLEPGDRQRTLRALEVVLGSGRALSDWLAEKPAAGAPWAALKIGLTLPRALLYDRLAVRLGRMLEAGWLEEVTRLLRQGVSPAAPAFQALGYRQLARHLSGELSLQQALQETLLATRRYAKRQLTWFRGDPEIHWFSAEEPERVRQEVLDFLREAPSRWDHG